jgi:hypothetical protein
MGQPKRKEKDDTVPEKSGPAGLSHGAPDTWELPAKLGRTSLGVIAAVVVLFNLPLIHYYLFRAPMTATVALPYQDTFSSSDTVAANYWSSGGLWRTVNGELLSPGVKNNPLWLKASLPQNVAVEFDVRSMSPEGDVKVEIFGDGSDHASGYVLIHGGWNNTVSIIARLDEHGASLASLQALAQRRGGTDLVQTGVFTKDTRMRVEAAPYPVQIGKTYHWRIERRGSLITWSIDGNPFMRFDDPFPLAGKGHDRLGFSSWEAQLYFDNLKIEPL